VNAYSEMKINNDISNASIDAKEQEAMSLWEPDKDGQPPAPPIANTSALIRYLSTLTHLCVSVYTIKHQIFKLITV
jgi:hypothetical protein